VQGASLVGTPVVQIGFNDDLAWTHTVSTSKHFTFYKLKINPRNVMEYSYGSGFRSIKERLVQIDLKLPNGNIVPFSKKVYDSHYGPIIATPELKWDLAQAFT